MLWRHQKRRTDLYYPILPVYNFRTHISIRSDYIETFKLCNTKPPSGFEPASSSLQFSHFNRSYVAACHVAQIQMLYTCLMPMGNLKV